MEGPLLPGCRVRVILRELKRLEDVFDGGRVLSQLKFDARKVGQWRWVVRCKGRRLLIFAPGYRYKSVLFRVGRSAVKIRTGQGTHLLQASRACTAHCPAF